MNLLEETREDLQKYDRRIADIVFIGSHKSGHSCTWEQFIDLADFDYDDGYGAPKIATDLIIVFCDGSRLWRNEYDGSEWWEFMPAFSMPKERKAIKRLNTEISGWITLSEIQDD